jgi:hypothetical protein
VHGIPLVQTLLVYRTSNPQGVRIPELDSLGDAHQADFQVLLVHRMPEDPQGVRIPKTRVTNKDFP